MRFLAHIAEFDFASCKDNNASINSNTSVNEVKTHYFETLSEIGEIIKIGDKFEFDELQFLCKQDDVIFACFHESPPDDLACRLLSHTKGSLMLPGGLLNKWTFCKTTINIVTSQKQANQLIQKMHKAAPLLGVFVSKMNTQDFRLPTIEEKENARNHFGIKYDTFHIVFGGRFISNKGIAQLLRAINLWPEKNIKITLVGDFELDFFIYQSNATHTTFNNFFDREILGQNKHCELRCLPSMNHKDLCNLFWSSDCFAFPSFHEDEAIGTTPRLAMLCGVPVVATDFCGFGQLSETNTGLLKTFPTLGGVRFSLKQLSEEIIKIKKWTKKEKRNKIVFNSEWLLDFCNTDKNKEKLKKSAEQLLKIQVGDAPEGDWRSRERFDKWVKDAPNEFKEAAVLSKKPYPEGLYVDGTGDIGLGWYSEPHFLKAIQGIYTTLPEPPKVKKGECYRGFWRISLWEGEQSIVEFGFPGPRMKKYNHKDWNELVASSNCDIDSEVVFKPKNSYQKALIQDLVELGYLVPDNI